MNTAFASENTQPGIGDNQAATTSANNIRRSKLRIDTLKEQFRARIAWVWDWAFPHSGVSGVPELKPAKQDNLSEVVNTSPVVARPIRAASAEAVKPALPVVPDITDNKVTENGVSSVAGQQATSGQAKPVQEDLAGDKLSAHTESTPISAALPDPAADSLPQDHAFTPEAEPVQKVSTETPSEPVAGPASEPFADPPPESSLTSPQDPASSPDFSPAPLIPPRPVPYPAGGVNYAIMPYLTREYGFGSISSLRERVGEYDKLRQSVALEARRAWVRMAGQDLRVQDTHLQAQSRLTYFQSGMDVLAREMASGEREYIGIMASIGGGNADTEGRAHGRQPMQNGKVSLTALGIGGYYTFYRAQESYLDMVMQLNHYTARLRTVDEERANARRRGHGLALSAEVGKPVAVYRHWFIEPQAQLIYQYVNLRGLEDGESSVQATKDHAVRARLGIRVFRQEAISQRWPLYVIANVLHDFGKARPAVVGAATIQPDFARTWWQAGFGAAVKINKTLSWYVDARYEGAFAGGHSGLSGNIGIRGNW